MLNSTNTQAGEATSHKMFKVGLSGFRVFEQTQEVEIRPITLLTGGNSSGKTSFMAAVRMLSDLSEWMTGAASFNKDPFFLGSFDQVAHHRGGRYGRVKQFTLSASGTPNDEPFAFPSPRTDRIKLPSAAHISLTYKNRFGQPALACCSYSSSASSVAFEYSGNWESATLTSKIDDNVDVTQISGKELPPPDLVSSQGLYLTNIVERLLFSRHAQNMRAEGAPIDLLSLVTHFRSALNMLPRIGFAGAPVRTRPLRTYDPTESAPQSEGSHVPSLMAQLARTRPSEWAKTRSEIVQFGQSSGLFKDIEVRSLGRGDSDPFQINVVINGPKRNIVDVGYGVSQAIPIIFELSRRRDDSLYIMQQPEVHLHPEAQAALGSYVVQNINKQPGYVMLETHSDFLIDRIRRHIREGLIAPEHVSLLYFHREGFASLISRLEISKAGEIINAPDGYRSFFLREQIANLSS